MNREAECCEVQEKLQQLENGRPVDLAPDVLRHLSECGECCADRELILTLAGPDMVSEPTEVELDEMRRRVLHEVAAERFVGRSPLPTALWAAAASVVFFATGLYLGTRSQASPAPAASQVQAASGDSMKREIHLAALRNRRIEDVENSPFSYSHVQVAQIDPSTVELRFDVSRHMELRLPKRDPIVAEVLVGSMLEPSPLGEKLDVISAAEDLPDAKIRAALIRSMLNDPSVAVRLKAEERLIQYAKDAPTEEALLRVLAKDDSVQMRLVAIDYLTAQKVSPRLLRDALASSRPEGRSALYVRAGNYIVN